MDPAVVAAIIGAVSAVAVVVVGAFLGLRSYRQQKQVDRDQYREQKEVDRQEYREQKAVDRAEELRKERAKAYATYLSGYAEMERWRGVAGKEKEFAEALLAYSKNYSALFNVAEDNVLIPTSEFHEFALVQTNPGWDYDRWLEEWRRRYAKMLLLMRKDAFVAETAIFEDELAKRLPWDYDWDMREKSQEQVSAAP